MRPKRTFTIKDTDSGEPAVLNVYFETEFLAVTRVVRPRPEKRYCVTHLPTGCRISDGYKTLRKAAALLDQIAGLGDWQFGYHWSSDQKRDPAFISLDPKWKLLMQHVHACLRSLSDDIKPVSGKARPGSQQPLPRRRLTRLLDQKNAK